MSNTINTVVECKWNDTHRLLVARLQGRVNLADVRRWKESLQHTLDQMADGTAFKLIADFFRYEYADLAAHKEMRSVIPLALAEYGFRTALLDLFDPVELPLQHQRGITCTAAAHVNHDVNKMTEYDRKLGRANERFFTDYHTAEAWILSLG